MERLSKKAIQEVAARATGRSVNEFFVEIDHAMRSVFVKWQDSMKGPGDGMVEQRKVQAAVADALPPKYQAYRVGTG